ncbi:nucleotidyl transferase AbiEii/AbiGii toxin family protein [bacterium]|nr:nucleotidyl transferase AbiEii/AbiGii toxin family protein [bacterium]MCI0603470.1 nucleotidyl transferase AbiEii/AbiGii toxin family protein [bacterium]
MEFKILTPLQGKVLQTLFNNDLGNQGFYLTGGTALSEFYLQHRKSEDLDLFTREDKPFFGIVQNISEYFAPANIVISSQEIKDDLVRIWIKEEGTLEPPLKLEFASKDMPALAATVNFDRIVVDSFLDIAVNKVCTILHRGPSEFKDYCDLYFILKKEPSFSLEYLMERAKEKDGAFDEAENRLNFATILRSVSTFQELPHYVLKPVALNEMINYLVPQAERIIGQYRPKM